jgi:hypothetical protein
MVFWAFKRIFPVQKPVRRLFEAQLRRAASTLPANAKVLDFASSGNKYRRYFSDQSFVGGDIILPDSVPTLDKDTQFVQGDLNNNPFANNVFDVVVTTNSINYSGDEEKTVRQAYDALIANLRADGTFITMVTQNWPLSQAYLGWVEADFQEIEKRRYDGEISRLLSHAVLYLVTRRQGVWLRRVNAAILRILSSLMYPGLLSLGDIYLPGTRHAWFVVARRKKSSLGGDAAASLSGGKFSHLKSPLNFGPLREMSEDEAGRLRPLFADVLRNGEAKLVDAVLSDGNYAFPVVRGIPRLMRDVAVPVSGARRHEILS